jgi:hypothetical protein
MKQAQRKVFFHPLLGCVCPPSGRRKALPGAEVHAKRPLCGAALSRRGRAQVGRGHLRRCCDQCGGALACAQPPAAHAAGLAVFRGIARFHGFQLLAEAVEWLLGGPGVG